MSDDVQARIDALRDAVTVSFAYRLDELNRKSDPMTPEQLAEREARKMAEQDAAISRYGDARAAQR